MNKTININIANTAFIIDEIAFALLKDYLNQLEKTFKNTKGKEEIIDDIEARIAELFQERKKNADYVFNQQDVQFIIETLGAPTAFEEDTEEKQHNESDQNYIIDKKLFRDPDDKYISGVAAGISHYFGFDSTWIRLFWLILALFSGGTFVVIYLIFWMLVPEAKTTSDKLRMKGMPINIGTIEKKIREEFEAVSARVKNINYEEMGNNAKKKSKNFFNFLTDLIGGIAKFVFKLFGLLFIVIAVIGSLCWCIGFALFFIFKTIDWPLTIHIWGSSPFLNTLAVIGVFISGIIPLFFLFLLGNFVLAPQKTWFGTSTSIILLLLWIISLLGVTLYAFIEYETFSLNTHMLSSCELQYSAVHMLYAPK